MISCNSKNETNLKQDKPKSEFTWSEDLNVQNIPDYDIKGFLNGKEVSISYINFEKWRGSNDNIINFSVIKPEQSCGFIEKFQGFQLINKGNQFEQGDWSKAKFEDASDSHSANFQYYGPDGSSYRSNASWACALKIESIDNKKVTGRIALTFNDDKKSWLAGKFVALICNN